MALKNLSVRIISYAWQDRLDLKPRWHELMLKNKAKSDGMFMI